MAFFKRNKTSERLRRLGYLGRAVGLVWRSSPGWTLANGTLLVVQAVLPLLGLYLIGLIIDVVTKGVAAGSQGQALFWEQVAGLLMLAGGLALLADLSRGLADYTSEAQGQAVTDHVHKLLHAQSVALDLAYYENAAFLDTLHRAQSDAPYRPNQILNRLLQGGQSGITLLGVALLLVSLHWATALLLFGAVLPGVVLRLKYTDQLYRRWREWTPQQRRADYFSWLLTDATHAKEVRLFGLGTLFGSRFRGLRQQISRERLSLARGKTAVELVMRFSTTLAVFSAWGFMVHQSLLGAITLGSLVMYYAAFQRGQSLLQETLGSLSALYENSLFIANFYEFLALKSDVPEPAQPRPVPAPLQVGICFDRVSFSYPNEVGPVLQELSFTIGAGEKVAIVGENGAGKTTLIKLLCRLYDPTGGSISLDGIDLREFKTAELRQQMSVLFQDYARYNLSAGENIGLGDSDEWPSDGRIESAARQAGADKAIERLPYGYETTLGNQFEEGHELSIGEWQKVAIARAFVRPAQVVILDEPSSALDANAEQWLFEQFRQLTEGRTAIFISHRLSTVSLADRIFVLDGGRLTESGTHQELLALKGTYARLFQTQARYYQL